MRVVYCTHNTTQPPSFRQMNLSSHIYLNVPILRYETQKFNKVLVLLLPPNTRCSIPFPSISIARTKNYISILLKCDHETQTCVTV